MIRLTRYSAPLAALLGATVALGACGSDGDDGGGATPSADDPVAGADDGADDGATGDVGGGADGAAAGDGPAVVPDELPGATGAGAGDATDAGADTDDAQAGATDESSDPAGTDADESVDAVAGGETGTTDPGSPDPDAPDLDAPDPGADATDIDDVDAPDDGDALTGTASRFGLVSVIPGDGDGEEAIVAAFYGLDEALPLDDAAARPVPAPDTCTFDTGTGGIDANTGLVVPALDDPGLTPLSAGENVVVSGPGGTFATLQRTEALGFVVYAPEGGTVPGPIPSGLVVDVPGGDFPAFAAVRAPDAPPLTGVAPADLGSVTADTTFGWDAGADPATRVIVEIALLGTDPLVSVTCSAADDGEFRLPASLLARVPDGQPASASLARVGVRALREGDAVLLVTRRSTPD